MSEQYFTVNIRAYLDKDESTYIGEDSLYELLSDFSCPRVCLKFCFVIEGCRDEKYAV